MRTPLDWAEDVAWTVGIPLPILLSLASIGISFLAIVVLVVGKVLA